MEGPVCAQHINRRLEKWLTSRTSITVWSEKHHGGARDGRTKPTEA